MIQEKLENQIFNTVIKEGREVKLIVMHPQTWINLYKEVTNKDCMAINKLNLKYKGIKVFRSLDLLEGEFAV